MTKAVTIRGQQRWDYHLETRKTETALLRELTELGQQGWELVDILYYKDIKGSMAWSAFLKRPSAAPPPSTGQPPAAGIEAHVTIQPPGEKPPEPAGLESEGEGYPIKNE